MTAPTLSRFLLSTSPSRPWFCLVLLAIGACGTASKDRDPQEKVPLTNLEQALRKNGLNPIRGGSVRQPFLGGEGVLYQIGPADLQVYLYADAGAVARDTDPLDTTRVAPPTMQISWRMPPTLIVDNNMAAILLTQDAGLRRKIRTAIERSHRD